MTEFYTDEKDNGKTIETAITRRFGFGARNKLFKALRNRDVKINGIRTGKNDTLIAGSLVTLYDDFEKEKIKYHIIFENCNFFAIEKPQGVPVQADRNGELCLIDALRNDLCNTAELCHRLDRNTGGIILISRNPGAEEIIKSMLDSSNGKTVLKYYTCAVFGKLDTGGGFVRLENYLFKDNKKSMVYIYDSPRKGAVNCALEYKSLSYDSNKDITVLKVHLLTGRTHQIRAQFAHIGHPVAGDGKYGREDLNKKIKYSYQALWASEMLIPTDCGLFENTCVKSPEMPSQILKTLSVKGKRYYTISSEPDFR